MAEILLNDIENGTLTLRGKEIAVRVGYASHNELIFYPENPRIYNVVGVASEAPSQDEIFGTLKDMEHVKQLVQSIKNNGGLHDPIIIRGNIVLEGNSRLAAYRLLAEKDPVKWGRIKCKVLPDTIDDDLVFALLGEYHIVRKKDWPPYQQAGYVYRRNKTGGTPAKVIAKELTMSTKRVNQLIDTYEFMRIHNETDINRWSYYEEYLKIKNIKQIQKEYENIDSIFATKVQTGEIHKAADVRDKLKIIFAAKPKTINKFLSGEKNFYESCEAAQDQGHSDGSYKTLHKFRSWIVDSETEEELWGLPEEIQAKCVFEIKKIHKRIENILKKMH